MIKVIILSILIAYSLIPLVHSCVSISSTSWSTSNECYECANCPNPFLTSSTLVSKKICGTFSVACAVSFF